ncbi:MAG TPA: type II CAAX endopeptidase family protein [Bacilli bacterium]
MEIIRGKRNGNVYQISFWFSLIGFLLLPVIFLFPFLILLDIKDANFDLSNLILYYQDSDFQSKMIITQFIAEVVGIVIIIGFLKNIYIYDFKSLKDKWYYKLLIVVGGVILLYVTNIILITIYENLGIIGESENQNLVEEALASNMRGFMIIMVVIVAPIFEEVIFRKLLIGYLTEKAHLSDGVSFLISTFTFALIHVLDPASIVYIFIYLALSAIITLSYFLSKKNIYVSTILHMLNNFLSL